VVAYGGVVVGAGSIVVLVGAAIAVLVLLALFILVGADRAID